MPTHLSTAWRFDLSFARLENVGYRMKRALTLLIVLAMSQAPAAAQGSATADVVARGRSLELPTRYEPPPGDPLSHQASGFAKIMCSAVFVSGFEPDFAAANLGYFIAPFEMRAKVGKPVVDRAAKEV